VSVEEGSVVAELLAVISGQDHDHVVTQRVDEPAHLVVDEGDLRLVMGAHGRELVAIEGDAREALAVQQRLVEAACLAHEPVPPARRRKVGLVRIGVVEVEKEGLGRARDPRQRPLGDPVGREVRLPGRGSRSLGLELVVFEVEGVIAPMVAVGRSCERIGDDCGGRVARVAQDLGEAGNRGRQSVAQAADPDLVGIATRDDARDGRKSVPERASRSMCGLVSRS
jgi:hypothetical protein